ncbi:MAG TPA: hypothetical protein VJ777_18750, partial [Mycobacterium sp.]|nr:hypothetical protein [Mycobacterium sp.]
SQHIRQNDIEAMRHEAPSEPAGVLRAERCLSSAFRTTPRCLGTCHDELTNVVDVNERCSGPARGEPASGNRLPDSRASSKHKRG